VDERGAKALQGKRVVVTRAAEQSGPLVEALREKGAVPVMLPMVTFGPPDNPAFLDEAIRHLPSYDWVFLTSQNALRALQERCAILQLEPRQAFGSVKIAAVGPATAEAAEHAGLHVSYVATKHQGVAMAEELAERVQSQRVLLPRSDRANPELVDTLRREGARVYEVCAYKTLPTDRSESREAAKIVERGADAVLFFSPSAVHHFRDTLGKEKFVEFAGRMMFTAIGPVTEQALHDAGVEQVLLARDTSVSAVVEALTEHFVQAGAGLSAGVKRG
jgi:uroporphyrinogen-III synthase